MVAVNLFSALRLLTELADAHAAESGQLFALVRLYLTSADAYYVGLLFWSLGTAAASYLWLQSNYIPRLLAICGLASSGWCAMCTLYYYIDPNVSEAGLWWFDSPLGIFELALSFWLVFKGLGAHGVAEVQPASGTT